jgi:magnesium-transporting ATPase (P-type)
MVSVIRNKELKRLHEDDVVVGDIIKLVEGMVVIYI